MEEARQCARVEHTTLDAEFRRWLADRAQRKERADEAMPMVERLRATCAPRPRVYAGRDGSAFLTIFGLQ